MTTFTSATPSTYRLFVGIDIAMATATASWISPGEAASRAITFDQTAPGFALLQQQLLSTDHRAEMILVVMEATGSSWITLATTLTKAGFVVSVVNPAQAHHFATALLKRAKTDAIDAQTLARLAHLLQPAPWTPPPAVYAELQQRLAQRETLLALRQQVRESAACTHSYATGGSCRPTAHGAVDPDLDSADRAGRLRTGDGAHSRRILGSLGRTSPDDHRDRPSLSPTLFSASA